MTLHTVYIVRHGETDFNVEGRWQGHLDVALNDEGRQQATALARYLQTTRFDAAYSSDLVRAAETARIVWGNRTGTIRYEPRLREVSLGIFQGLTRQQIATRFPHELTQWDTSPHYVIPDGESRTQLQERSYEAWADITSRSGIRSTLLVSHGGTLRLMLMRVLQIDNPRQLHFANTSLTILERADNGPWQTKILNSVAHLAGSD